MTNGADTTKFRLGKLEKAVDKLDTKMEKVMENHLPHIQAEQIKQATRINVLTAVNIGAIILAALISKLL